MSELFTEINGETKHKDTEVWNTSKWTVEMKEEFIDHFITECAAKHQEAHSAFTKDGRWTSTVTKASLGKTLEPKITESLKYNTTTRNYKDFRVTWRASLYGLTDHHDPKDRHNPWSVIYWNLWGKDAGSLSPNQICLDSGTSPKFEDGDSSGPRRSARHVHFDSLVKS